MFEVSNQRKVFEPSISVSGKESHPRRQPNKTNKPCYKNTKKTIVNLRYAFGTRFKAYNGKILKLDKRDKMLIDCFVSQKIVSGLIDAKDAGIASSNSGRTSSS